MRLINIDCINLDPVNAPKGDSPRRTKQPLDAQQAAARLGVKRATLYAYVSRGILARTVSLDGRTSLFDTDEIERVRRSRGRRQAEQTASVVSAITELDEDGHRYRGVPVLDLLADDVPFEEVANHLWLDHEPWGDVAGAVESAQPTVAAVGSLPDTAAAVHRLSMAVTGCAAADSLRATLTPERLARCGRAMIIAMVAALPPTGSTEAHAQADVHERPPADATLADLLWSRFAATQATPQRTRGLNAALVLLADHGLAASTFAVRVAASVRADPYSMVQTGLGTVSGIHHGSSSAAVHRLLDRVETVGCGAAVGEILHAQARIPGLGHSIYRQRDPRTRPLLDLMAEAWPDDPRLELVDELVAVLDADFPLPLNVDFALGALTWMARADADATAVFALARTAGWLAHAMEELEERPVRFRPEGRYVADRSPVPEDSL